MVQKSKATGDKTAPEISGKDIEFDRIARVIVWDKRVEDLLNRVLKLAWNGGSIVFRPTRSRTEKSNDETLTIAPLRECPGTPPVNPVCDSCIIDSRTGEQTSTERK